MEKARRLSAEEKERIKERVGGALREREEILFAYAHGSFLGEVGFRDMDLAVYLQEAVHLQEREITPERCLDYELSLSSYLERIVPVPVDVRVLNFAPLGFQYQVTKGALLFCRDKTLHADYLEKTWYEYLDFDFHRRESLKDLLRP